MKILSWNVNGIRSVVKKGFFDWLKKESPDILCLQETKARPDQLPAEISSPAGYHAYWNYPDRKGYAGVAVFSKKEPENVKKNVLAEGFDSEGRILSLEYPGFTLVNVYFPNGRMGEERLKYKLEFYRRFLDFLDGSRDENIIFCGDVNTAHRPIDLARPKQNELYSGFLPEERLWLDKFVEHGFVDSYRYFNGDAGHYTWWDFKSSARERNVGWRIDYFFVQEGILSKLKDAFILDEVYGSDHCPVGIEIAGYRS